MSTVLVAHIYLLHRVGIYPLESTKEENHASPGNTNSAGSQTCSATRLAMAIIELPQVSSTCVTELPIPPVLLCIDLQTFSISLSRTRSWQLLKQGCNVISLCHLAGILSSSSSSPSFPPWNRKLSCPWYLQSTSYVVSWCSVEGLPERE